jgi:hypothetical protein
MVRGTFCRLDQANLFFKIAGPMLIRSTVSDTETGLAKLKDIVESQG